MSETSSSSQTASSSAAFEAQRLEVISGMEEFVGDQLGLLAQVDKNWQPSDFLPDLSLGDWREKIGELRETTKALTDDILVVLVGDMVTEEALPSYQTMLNRFDGVEDLSGASESSWAKWSRGWTAEENRHGDLLNKFLYFTGRVDMHAIETTIQHLIRNGFDALAARDPYKGFIYTSFQERATKISHSNVARIVKDQGCPALSQVCSVIAADEARHEEAYKRFAGKIFDVDPSGAIIAFRDMMKNTIQMPARLMSDGVDFHLFDHFSAVAQRMGVYTAQDYSDIIDHLVERWKIADLKGLFGDAARAQDYLCELADRYRRLAERVEAKIARQPRIGFSWIFNRTA